MANDLNILIKSKIDQSSEAITNLNNQLSKLEKKMNKLKIKLDVDSKDIENAVKNATNKAKSNSNVKINVFDRDKLESDGRQFFISATNIVSRVKKEFASMGDVNVNVFKNAKEQVTGFTAEIKKADGVVEKLNFDMAKIKTNKSLQKGFVFTGQTLLDKNAGDNLQATLNKLQQYQTKLNQIKASFSSGSSGVIDKTNLGILNKEYNSILSVLENLRKSQTNLTNEQKRNIDKQINSLKELGKAYKEIDNVKNKKDSTENEIKRINNSLEKLKVNKEKVFADSRVSAEVDELKNMEGQYRKGAISAKDYAMQMDNVRTKTAQVSGELRNVNKDGYSFTSMVSLAAKKIAIWAISTNIIYGSLQQLRLGLTYMADLDNALNEIRIVTGKSQEQVDSLGASYNRLAKEMSVTTKEIASTSADLYRQGLSTEEVEGRMKSIIQYAKISSLSLEDSNKIITATANATKESVTKIIDIFALLGRQNCPLAA